MATDQVPMKDVQGTLAGALCDVANKRGREVTLVARLTVGDGEEVGDGEFKAGVDVKPGEPMDKVSERVDLLLRLLNTTADVMGMDFDG